MGGKGDLNAAQESEKKIAGEQLKLGEKQDKRSEDIYNLSMPGLKTSTQHYSDLASGDPTAIARAVGPGTQQISQQFDKQKEKIGEAMPRGGARDLAMEETDISKAGAVGDTINKSYEGSFDKLANLAGKNMGLSINDVSNAISAFGGASTTSGNIASQDEQGKAAMMGMIGQIASGTAQGAGAAMA